jgi:hypothetical protein
VLKMAVPRVHVKEVAVAEDFCCNLPGFRKYFAHRADEAKPDPCYAGVTRDQIWMHASSFSGDGV